MNKNLRNRRISAAIDNALKALEEDFVSEDTVEEDFHTEVDADEYEIVEADASEFNPEEDVEVTADDEWDYYIETEEDEDEVEELLDEVEADEDEEWDDEVECCDDDAIMKALESLEKYVDSSDDEDEDLDELEAEDDEVDFEDEMESDEDDDLSLEDLDDELDLEEIESSEVAPGVEDSIRDTSDGMEQTVSEIVPQGSGIQRDQKSEVFPTNSKYVAKIVSRLDKIASALEKNGDIKHATQIDEISNLLESKVKGE